MLRQGFAVYVILGLTWLCVVATLNCASGGSTVDVKVDDAAIACGEGDVDQDDCVKEK